MVQLTPILMPQIGQDITVGRIIEWLKREGEPVEKGEVILTVESEKATFEIEAEDSGVLLKILQEAGAEAEVLSTVGYIGQPGEKPPAENRNETPRINLSGSRPRSDRSAVHDVMAKQIKQYASPSARRVAAD